MIGEEALDRVLKAYGPGLWRLAGSFEFDPDRRADLYQEMLLAIWRALPRLDQPDRLKAYVFRIARNRAVSHVAGQVLGPGTAPLHEEPPDLGACPLHELEQGERQARLAAAVRALPLGLRETVSLFFEGLSHAEIATVLEITENNVAVRINRARSQLSRRLSS